MKKAAIFDMDGVLFDTERLYRESWVETAAQFGQAFLPAFPAAVCGTSGAKLQAVVREYYPAVDAAAFVECCMERVRKVLREQPVPEKPGLHEILTFFRGNGVKIAVASSSEPSMIESNLRRTGVIDHFDAIVSGVQMPRSKPAPDIFLEAARRLGCAPADCYVFEDGLSGLRAGLAAGCATVMIPDLTPPTDELRAACAAICDSLHAVIDAIRVGTI